MSDDRLHDARQRGVQAAQLIENELLNETLDKLKAAYCEAMLAVPPGDDRVTYFHIAATTVDKIKTHLHSVLVNGQIAQRELNDIVAKQGKRWGVI